MNESDNRSPVAAGDSLRTFYGTCFMLGKEEGWPQIQTKGHVFQRDRSDFRSVPRFTKYNGL
jgi:hypothetical protein